MNPSWTIIPLVFVGLIIWAVFFKRPVESMKRETLTEQEIPRGKIEILTFGDGLYREQSQRFAERLRSLSFCSRVHSFTGDDMDDDFRSLHNDILKQPRGFGYWLWKPYFCKRVWDNLCIGDVLVYLDGGLTLKGDLMPYIDRAIRSKSGGVAFEQWIRQENYCKPETFTCMNMPVETYGKLLQFWAAIIIVQKRSSNLSFFKEWLEYCTIPGLIDDSPSNIQTKTKYKHRHDQSIYSLMAWKYEFDIDLASAYMETYGRPVSRNRPRGYKPAKDT
jgi:hypothetical protein